LLLNCGMTGASGDHSFGPYFGPYAPGREGPRGNGPTRKTNYLGRVGPRQTARNTLQVLVFSRKWRFKSSHPHQ
jgi:hypothetical protein